MILEALGLEEIAIEVTGQELLVSACRRVKAVLTLFDLVAGVAGLGDGSDADRVGTVVYGACEKPSEEDTENSRVILLQDNLIRLARFPLLS